MLSVHHSATRPAVEGGFYYDMYLGRVHDLVAKPHLLHGRLEKPVIDIDFVAVEKCLETSISFL